MLNLTQRLILGCVSARGLHGGSRRGRAALRAAGEGRLGPGILLGGGRRFACGDHCLWCCGRFTCWLATPKRSRKETWNIGGVEQPRRLRRRSPAS